MPISQKMITKIKIAQKELCLSDEDYRATLKAHFNRTSCTKLSPMQAEQLLRHFQKMGWQPNKQQKLPGMGVPTDGQSKKIQALWITLYQAGKVRDGSDKALMVFCKGMTAGKGRPGKEHLKFCDSQDKWKIIEALKDWATREGVDVG